MYMLLFVGILSLVLHQVSCKVSFGFMACGPLQLACNVYFESVSCLLLEHAMLTYVKVIAFISLTTPAY